MSNQGIFWVKVNLDPSIHHDLPSKSLNFWLELDPTCTVGTAINRMKNGFGIVENVALFLEGYFLPSWMSAAMLMHAKEPVFVQPWIAESRLCSFADMDVASTPNSQTFCSCNKGDNKEHVNNNNDNNESCSVAAIIKANSISPRRPNPLTSSANLSGQILTKLETPDGKNMSEKEETNEAPRKKVGRPPKPRKAPVKSKTPDHDVNDDDEEKYDTTPTSRRRSRRLAKTPIEDATSVNNPNKRKADVDLQASPLCFAKRSRTISKSPVGTSKSTDLKSDNTHTATEVKLFEATKKADDFIDIDAFLLEAGIAVPKEEVIVEDVVSTPTEIIAPSEAFSNKPNKPETFMVSLNEFTGELQAAPTTTVPTKSPQIQQGCWIKFQETMEGPMEIGTYNVENISYVASMNGPMMTLTCPDYDSIDQPDCLKWKQRILNLETISSSAQIITQEEALQAINETYPIRSIFNVT